MKSLAILLVVLSFVSSAKGQSLPDNPAPVPLADPAWSRLQSLVNGQPIIVDNTNGPPVHCFFAGVTDAFLFCNPPGNPAGVGFRFNHADVLGVDYDLPRAASSQASRPERNYHPAWISSMIAGGVIVGLVASKTTDAGTAATDGIIGAGIAGLIGAPLAFFPHPQFAPAAPVYSQYGIAIPLRRLTRPRANVISALRLFR
jgi:uncharacterized membrane protein YeaQ/YmgE (transglycosylase-associated protein family)